MRTPDTFPDNTSDALSDTDIAVIGFAGRFPGGLTAESLWSPLLAGEELHHIATDDELLAAGIPADRLSDPSLVRRRPSLPDPDMFDAQFFGFSARDAAACDPQQRLFLEVAWETFENAGYDPRRFDGAAAVFAGGGPDTYLHSEVLPALDPTDPAVHFARVVGNERDFIAPRVAYRLGLTGPALTVLSGCATSLVAVHLAAQSLINGESDLALAGGATVFFPEHGGYWYQPGGIVSPDGRCRPFSADAKGTVTGDAVAAVLLKRYAEAVEDGDTIHAVIKGSAVNNDGADKVGFTAPSPRGQAAVIAEALAVGEVDPSTISYVETHGTATRVGDAIEVEALEEALSGGAPGSCLLGALKPVIGHTDTAAGVSALIKVLLSLKHGMLPPVPDFRQSSPSIDFESSVCRVNDTATAWPRTPGSPRRAGISAFSIGGTNAHVVVEEPPLTAPTGGRSAAPDHYPLVLPVSAATPTALGVATTRLADALDGNDIDPADAATTLSVGRAELGFRRHVTITDPAHTADAVRRSLSQHPVRARGGDDVVFVFPGQGSQFPGMGSDLYRDVPAFADAVDRCAEEFAPSLGLDLRQFLTCDSADRSDDLTRQLARTELTQPALFTVEYATVAALRDLGITPTVVLGHSIGEFAAATAAGVLELGDAVAAVAARGRLMADTAAGASAVARCSEDDVRSALIGTSACVAAVNGPKQVVVSGTNSDVTTVVQRLLDNNYSVTLLPTDRAFHSPLVDSAVGPFREVMRTLRLHAPRIPMIRTSTAETLDAVTAADVDTWSTQLRAPVRFADSVAVADRNHPNAVWVEVGPGTALGSLVRSCGIDTEVVATVGRPESAWPSGAAGADLAGRLWCAGAKPDLTRFSGSGRRVPLPTYPFERQRHRIGRPAHPVTVTTTTGAGAITRAERPETGTEFVAPRSGVERTVADVVAEALGLERFGAHDDLFSFGGDSVTATAVAARLSETYPVDVTLADIMASPATPSGISERLTSLLTDAVEDMSEEEVARMLTALADPA